MKNAPSTQHHTFSFAAGNPASFDGAPPAASFSDLYTRHYGSLVYWILSVVKNKSIAEDVCSLAFTRAFESYGDMRNPAKFKQWLYAIAYNEAKRSLRRGRFEPMDETMDFEDPHDFVMDLETYYEIRRAHQALRMMKGIYRQAIQKYVRGESCQAKWGSRLHKAKQEASRIVKYRLSEVKTS